MTLCDRLEDTLNGGWPGLYGEVVTEDTYRLKQLKFEPDIIFDIGANVGTFSRFARELFPKAAIYALEPDPVNAAHFRKFTNDPNTFLTEAALGRVGAQVYHGKTAANGAGETYLSSSPGYPGPFLKKDPYLEACSVEAIPLHSFCAPRMIRGAKCLLKLDCEGAENSIFNSMEDLAAFKSMDYICAELHFYSLYHSTREDVLLHTMEAIISMSVTHLWTLQGVHFWATRRSLC